jgi:hypothetical protein
MSILASDNRHLASASTGPEPLETLPVRMVAFLARHQDLCEAYAEIQQAGLTFPTCSSDAGRAQGIVRASSLKTEPT